MNVNPFSLPVYLCSVTMLLLFILFGFIYPNNDANIKASLSVSLRILHTSFSHSQSFKDLDIEYIIIVLYQKVQKGTERQHQVFL